MDINKVRPGEMVAARSGDGRLAVGPVVFVDQREDIVSVRMRNDETRNFHAREIQSVNFLYDYFLNHRQNRDWKEEAGSRNGKENEKKLKGVLKSFLLGNVSNPLREEILEALKDIPEVRGQEILEIL